jgi:23S rRNA (cytosine1962-C5)-methyltransferase
LQSGSMFKCYRLYDHDLPEFPFAIDFYEDKLNVSEYRRRHGMSEEEHEQWMSESLQVISAITEVPVENIFMRQRQRKAGRQGQYEKIDSAKSEFVVHENDLRFKINLSDYLDTGLFLDHRITREMVKKESEGKKVLNLFCYTGSFSVYACCRNGERKCSQSICPTHIFNGPKRTCC